MRRETWLLVALATVACTGQNDSGKIPPSPAGSITSCARPARTWVVQSDTTWVGVFNFPQADYVRIPAASGAFTGNTTVPVDSANNANDVCATVTKASQDGSIFQPVAGTVTLTLQPDGISQSDSSATGAGVTICVPGCS